VLLLFCYCAKGCGPEVPARAQAGSDAAGGDDGGGAGGEEGGGVETKLKAVQMAYEVLMEPFQAAASLIPRMSLMTTFLGTAPRQVLRGQFTTVPRPLLSLLCSQQVK